MNRSTQQAYRFCADLAHRHYENFPIASFLLPQKLRQPITAIYAFARTADDLADEGNLTPSVRLEKLAELESKLLAIKQHPPNDPIFIALADAIEKQALPIQCFQDLLTAFKQDVIKNRYETFESVLEYCRYSANPIGRLMLTLVQQDQPDHLYLSDQICTALQLINFFQDLQLDLLKRNRCYLPQTELAEAQINVQDFLKQKDNPNIRDFLDQQLARVEQIFNTGLPLGLALSGLFGLEIRCILQSAQIVLHKLRQRKNIYDRPVLKRYHWPVILWRAVYV